MKLVAFTEYVYHRIDGTLYGERAFAVFLGGLVDHFDELTIVGREDPEPRDCHYALPRNVRFVALPHYPSLTQPVAVGSSLVRSVVRFWRAIADADRVWLLGPYPHAVAFALVTRLRRRPLVLGVRQDFPSYVRSRRPNRRWMHLAADILEWAWRRLARRSTVVVVGPDLAERYRRAPALLEMAVSLISDEDVETGAASAAARSYAGALRLLSVGRIDQEKNPLLLAEVLALLRERDPRWTLEICGDGAMKAALEARVSELGLSDHVTFHGYLPVHGGLMDLYRSSHVFLHISLTEGMPQVLIEAFGCGVPVVATAVGGVPAAVGGAALLIPPSDARSAADAVGRIASDPALRERLIEAGLEQARRQTMAGETGRVAAFIRNGAAPRAVEGARRPPD